ncbi:1,4-dihydroxy-2-naphthoate prenyltransferase, partial [Bifidobacterium stellenboschense]
MNRESSRSVSSSHAHASLRLWLSGIRPKTLPASIAPVLVGAACAWRLLDAPAARSCIAIDDRVWADLEMAKGPCFAPWYAYDGALARFVAMTLLCVGVALFLQIAVNFANDYSDGVRGTDASRGGSEAATGKPRRLVAS